MKIVIMKKKMNIMKIMNNIKISKVNTEAISFNMLCASQKSVKVNALPNCPRVRLDSSAIRDLGVEPHQWSTKQI